MEIFNGNTGEDDIIFCKDCGVRINDAHIPCRCNAKTSTTSRQYSTENTRQAHTEIQMDNNVSLVRERSKRSRPSSTKRQYGSKVAEYLKWCTTKGFPRSSEATVTNRKLLLFLTECVVDRDSRTKAGEFSNTRLLHFTAL